MTKRWVMIGLICCLVANFVYTAQAQVKPPTAGQEWHDPVSGIDFVWIPEGCFRMGCVSGIDCHDDEKPVHQVCFDEGFWMGKYEVTQEQWQRVMKKNPSYFNEQQVGKNTRNYPVEQVSWNDVQQFIQKLNEQTGDIRYRLPSEAEWEYAARAGTETAYSFGNKERESGEYAWCGESLTKGKTHPVGQLKPNGWGLHDMQGNVREWCAEPWHDDYAEAPTDGSVWESGGSTEYRVLRGGSWCLFCWLSRCAGRFMEFPAIRLNDHGFRVLCCSSRNLQ